MYEERYIGFTLSVLAFMFYIVGVLLSYNLLKTDYVNSILGANFKKRIKIEAMMIFWPVTAFIYFYLLLDRNFRRKIALMFLLLSIIISILIYL